MAYIWQYSAFSTVTHPLSPQTHLLLQLVAQQVQRKACLMGIINTPAVEHLWGNKGPNANFTASSSCRSEKHPVKSKHARVSIGDLPSLGETLWVNGVLIAVPPPRLLVKVPTERLVGMVSVALGSYALSSWPECSISIHHNPGTDLLMISPVCDHQPPGFHWGASTAMLCTLLSNEKHVEVTYTVRITIGNSFLIEP